MEAHQAVTKLQGRVKRASRPLLQLAANSFLRGDRRRSELGTRRDVRALKSLKGLVCLTDLPARLDLDVEIPRPNGRLSLGTSAGQRRALCLGPRLPWLAPR